jgi:hypothetical protein
MEEKDARNTAKNCSLMTQDSQILSHAGEDRLKQDNEAAGIVDRKKSCGCECY